MDREKFIQFVFSRQWSDLKKYCNANNIHLIGDLPVYVDYHSADVWTHPSFFKLNEAKQPIMVAGVPPDYFSATGQLWGLPIYNWDALRDAGYSWWIDRIGRNFKQCDILRIDHFRGFAGYWEVPAHEETALNGQWQDGPGAHFFSSVLRRFPQLPVIAEDLGFITPDVRELMREFNFPGMKVLLFAFGDDLASNPYAPHNIDRNAVVFTGTHDNNTVRGWFDNEATEGEKARLFAYLGREVSPDAIHWEMVRLALMSVADTAILPMQDIVGIGGEGRMNQPSRKEDNWHWQLGPDCISSELAQKLRTLTETYGRA
jgi:4-alpha-glucanotransferase